MDETQTLALAHLPGGLRTAAGQRLAAGEQVRHALLLEQPLAWDDVAQDTAAGQTALVITDRQLLVLEGGPRHLPATVDNVTSRLICPLEAILAVEVGQVLLSGWLEIRAVRRSTLQRLRLPLWYSQTAAVQAALGTLFGPGSEGPAGGAVGTGLLAELSPALRRAAEWTQPMGERIVAVLHAPPPEDQGRGRRRLRSPISGRPLRAVVATEGRLLLLEQPPPAMLGGARFGLVSALCPLGALEDAYVVRADGPVVTARLRLGREGAGFAFDVDLARAEERRWEVALAALATMRRRPEVTLDDEERRRFVLATGLGHVVVTEPAHYAVLLRHVEEYHRGLEAQGRPVSLVEAARDWCQSVYEPIAARLKAGRARLRLPDRTLADLFVRLCEHKWLVSERARRDIGLEAALQDFERWAS